MTKTAIIILNWNGLKYLRMFLGTVLRYSAGEDTTVYVADNGSTDGSADWVADNFKDVVLLRFDRNWGFAGGYNRAVEQVSAEYIVLINTDIEVTHGWLPPLVDYMDANRDTAACQPKIRSYNKKEYFEHAGAAGGFIDKYGYPFCRGRILNIAEKDEGQYNDQADIFWSSGACMIVRTGTWKECGGFDADFFAHMEEIDLCWRFSKAGYRTVFIPDSTVYHIGGGSLDYDSPFKIFLNFRNSLYMLYKNLPDDRFRSTLLIRKIMDGLAAIMFLAGGRFSYFRAVFKAHISYYKALGELRKKRAAVRSIGDGRAGKLILNKSVVFEFYVKGNRTFNSL